MWFIRFCIFGYFNHVAYLLSDHGYDIWLGNSRGNDHSLNHKTMSPESKEFWDFSWHEIGFYDLPAMIDYMLQLTNASKVFFVGNSQGTTSLLVMLSTRPEYNQKIIQAHLLGPAAFMTNFPRLKWKGLFFNVEVRNDSPHVTLTDFEFVTGIHQRVWVFRFLLQSQICQIFRGDQYRGVS
jgi:pimeloyl-ACP methyl ester carboxylesterase